MYPKAGDGRPPKELEMMLRVYSCSSGSTSRTRWKKPSTTASMRRFAGIDLGEMPVPDESTVLRFRHLLEVHGLGKKLFQQVHAYLERQGIKVGTGTIVDATIISAPPSTKNKDKSRDPDMHQTKKGNQWYFGMKAHIGVDSQTKVIHAVVATPANVHDSVCLPDLLHGEETRLWGGLGLSRTNRGHPKACAQGQRPHEPSLPVPGRRQ